MPSVLTGQKLRVLLDLSSSLNGAERRIQHGARLLTARVCIAIFSLFYLPVTILNASRRQMWNDELFTYYISRLTYEEVWKFLLTGADQNPPLFYWLTGLAMDLPGNPLLLIRLPEIIGFWVASACLIFCVSRFAPPVYGLLACGLLLLSEAYAFAYDARPYGMVAGFATLAFLAWQRLRGLRGPLWLAVLMISLAGAISVHYYSILLFVVIAAGEAVHTLSERKLRGAVWAALVVSGGLPLIFCMPLITAARGYSHHFWSRPAITGIGGFYTYMLGPAAIALAVLAGILCIAVLLRGSGETVVHAAQENGRLPSGDAVAALTWAALPFAIVPLAVLVTRAYTHRYVLSSTIAVCLLIAWSCSRLLQRRIIPILPVIAICFAMFAIRDSRHLRWPSPDRRPVAALLENHTPPGTPILIADPLMFFELSHQAQSNLRSRIGYAADAGLAIQYIGTDTIDRGLVELRAIAPLKVMSLEEMLGSGRPFYIYGYPAPFSWHIPEINRRKVPLQIAGVFGDRLLLLADPDASAASTRASGTSTASDRK